MSFQIIKDRGWIRRSSSNEKDQLCERLANQLIGKHNVLDL